MSVIMSPQNPVFRELSDCLGSKGIKKHGLFLISGTRIVRETLQRSPELVRNLIGLQGARETALAQFALSRVGDQPFSILEFAPELFAQLDVFGTHQPLLAVRAPEIEEADLSQAPAGLELLCGLSEPSNVGALIRSAAAFGVDRIIFLKESASPYHPKAVRAASGTTLMLNFARGPSIRDFVSQSVVALDMSGTSLYEFKWPENLRLLLGEEGQGVPKREGYKFISIPMANEVESLNATVAASVAMFAYRAQFTVG